MIETKVSVTPQNPQSKSLGSLSLAVQLLYKSLLTLLVTMLRCCPGHLEGPGFLIFFKGIYNALGCPASSLFFSFLPIQILLLKI